MDKIQKANELENEAKRLRIEANEEKRQVEFQKKENWQKTNKMDVYTSDDYCGLDAGEYHFYYGYEETLCPKHGKRDCYNELECEKAEWAFVATVGSKEVLRIPQSKIHPEEGEEPFWYLVAGIGHFLTLKAKGFTLKAHPEGIDKYGK